MSTRTTSAWQALDAAHHLHPFTDFKSLAAKGSRIITRAEGIHVWDNDGNKILDAMSGLWCVNVGYGQQALNRALLVLQKRETVQIRHGGSQIYRSGV